MRETVKNDGRTTQREGSKQKKADQIKRKQMSFLLISYVISRLIEFVSGVDIYEAEGGGKVKHMPCQELFPKVACDAKGRGRDAAAHGGPHLHVQEEFVRLSQLSSRCRRPKVISSSIFSRVFSTCHGLSSPLGGKFYRMFH